MNDDEFHQAFLDLALPPADFHHAEHVRAAWGCLRRADDFSGGAAQFAVHFRRYVAKIGAATKYHETITWFYLVLLHQRMSELPPAQTWGEFRAANPDLLDREMGPLRARYRPATLQSPQARRIFLLPDALPAGA
jgi:hypothetical protein